MFTVIRPTHVVEASPTPVVGAVAASLQERGFTPGLSAGVGLAVVMEDLDTAGEMICERCSWQGLMVQPWCCGERRALLLVCPRCDNESEG